MLEIFLSDSVVVVLTKMLKVLCACEGGRSCDEIQRHVRV